jgi:preprotein translocase subunit SecD
MNARRHKLHLAISLLVAFGGLAAVFFAGWSPRLGLDLSGGTSVILTAKGENVRSDVLSKTVSIIRQRIDSLGAIEPEVSQSGSNNIIVQLPNVTNEKRALDLIGQTAQLTFRQVEATYGPTTPKKKKPPVTDTTGPGANDKAVVYPSNQPGEAGTLYKLSPAVLTGDVVTKAEAVIGPSGSWSVTVDMDDQGAATWAKFTSKLACIRDRTGGASPRALSAIVLDGRVESASPMKDPTGAPGEGVVCGEGITGGQTAIEVGGQQEAKNLALVLRTGALPLTLEQSSVSKVSPTLGRDSLDAGLQAGALGLGLVLIYVLLYYRALGLVVWLGLAAFTATIYWVICVLGETTGMTLSLPGIAGIIVSVGITTDSFIVAFERLKDEVRAGKSMRAAVERGIKRAIRTVLVADTVTGLAAVILFFLAVGPVRGFALTLGLATAIDILMAYFLIRPSVWLLSRTRLFGTGQGRMALSEALGARRQASEGRTT